MDHIAAVRAALKAAAPVVAIPVEGRAPVCINARLLKGALKGVTINFVKVLENGSLQVIGADMNNRGFVRTSSTFAPMRRDEALKQIREWTIKEREKRIKVINQGVLNAQTRRDLLKAKIEAEADNALKAARREEAEILASVRERINPILDPVSEERRESILAEHRAYRAQCSARKRGSVILWRIKTLKAELEKITVKRGKRRERKQTFARKRSDIPRMLLMMQEIASLNKQFDVLCPPYWRAWGSDPTNGMWWDSWVDKRPKDLPYRVPWGWSEDLEENGLRQRAEHLRNVRADIRALTPPEDEIEQEQIAA